MSIFRASEVSGYFSYSNATRTFSTDASDLDWPVGDCPDETITIEGKTGQLVTFLLTTHNEDVCVYRPVDATPADLMDLKVVVFND